MIMIRYRYFSLKSDQPIKVESVDDWIENISRIENPNCTLVSSSIYLSYKYLK